MKLFSTLLFMLLLSTQVSTQAHAAENLNLSRRGVAVDGYDLVTYQQSAPQEGGKNISYEYRDAIYYFINEENLALFQAEPEKYLPEYGGYCAYAMLEGDQVKIDPETYKLVDGKLYLFYNGLFGDTLEKWNEKVAMEAESSLINTADLHWSSILSNTD